MPSFNDSCPFCGEHQLIGTVEAVMGEVPLYNDSQQTANANSYESEVTWIQCGPCQKEIEPHHYYYHDVFVDGEYEHCDCLPEPDDEEEESPCG